VRFDKWLKIGVSNGFCTVPYCSTHDGWAPEDDDLVAFMWESGDDPCSHVVRLKS